MTNLSIQKKAIVFTLAVMSIATCGCDYLFNIDIEVEGDSVFGYLTVTRAGATTEADFTSDVLSWYDSKPPVSITVDAGTNSARLCWKLATIGVDEHFGAKVKNAEDWTVGIIEYSSAAIENTALVEASPAPDALLFRTPANENKIRLTNPSATKTMRVTNFEFAVSTTDVPLINLNYFDAQVVGLPWLTVVSVDTDIAPLGSMEFDLPSGLPDSVEHCYMRSLSTSTSAGDATQAAAYKIPATNHIPAVSEWGVAVMALLVLVAGTVVLRRVSAQRLV